MKKNKLTPIEELRQEKRHLKRAYEADEERLLRNWNYLTNNTVTVLFNTAFNGAKGMVNMTKEVAKPFAPAFKHLGVFSILSSSIPIIWSIAQPILLSFAVKKVKQMFGLKKN